MHERVDDPSEGRRQEKMSFDSTHRLGEIGDHSSADITGRKGFGPLEGR
jgi:hypothetical protein